MGRRLAIVGTLILVLTVWREEFAARMILNIAKTAILNPDVASTRAESIQRLLLFAGKLAVTDAHLRGQLADSMARFGECSSAADTLQRLQENFNYLNAQDARLLATCQSYLGDQSGALATVTRYKVATLLSEEAAARLLWHLRQAPDADIPDLAMWTELIQTAFGLRSTSGARFIADALQEPEFWRSELGSRVDANVKWRAVFPRATATGEVLAPLSVGELHRTVADLLSTDSLKVRLRENIARNSTLDQPDPVSRMPRGWDPVYMATGEPWNAGYFSVAVDADPSGNLIARIDCLHLESKPDRELGRAGFSTPSIRLEQGKLYVVAVDYRVSQTSSDAVRVFLSTNRLVFPPIESVLPPSESWRHAVIVFRNSSSEAVVVFPAVRLFSTGTVWFDNFTVREIEVADASGLPEIGYAATTVEVHR